MPMGRPSALRCRGRLIAGCPLMLNAGVNTANRPARRKSGNYTVRRPLEIGAAMAGRDDVLSALGHYGTAIGEAFQVASQERCKSSDIDSAHLRL